MEPLTAGSAAAAEATTAGEAAAVTPTAAEAKATGLALREGADVATETSEVLLDGRGLLEQLDTIRHGLLESLAARNEAAFREVPQIETNRQDGAEREKIVGNKLALDYPEAAGYYIQSQCLLRDETGRVAIDPITGESRRLDFVVIKDSQVVQSVEVTSDTADKIAQLTKEDRIREAGGNFVIDRRTGELVPFAPGVKTEVERIEVARRA